MFGLPLLLEPAELLACLQDSSQRDQLLIVDLCKESVYQQAHIPHAVWLHSRHLVSGVQPATGTLPSISQLNQLFGSLGLTPDRHVVVYDDEGGGWAGRFIWTLDMIGHRHYSVVNGGLHAWLAAGAPIESQPRQPQATTVDLSLHAEAEATLDYLLAHYQDADHIIWDARSPDEYHGTRILAQRGGHIPHAVNYEWTRAMNRDEALKLRDLATVRQELAALGITPDKTVITHCQTHHRSGYTYLLGRILGFPKLKAYAGSWSEWGNRADTPIER